MSSFLLNLFDSTAHNGFGCSENISTINLSRPIFLFVFSSSYVKLFCDGFFLKILTRTSDCRSLNPLFTMIAQFVCTTPKTTGTSNLFVSSLDRYRCFRNCLRNIVMSAAPSFPCPDNQIQMLFERTEASALYPYSFTFRSVVSLVLVTSQTAYLLARTSQLSHINRGCDKEAAAFLL